ncbi:MAG: acyl-CoA dehydrogenase family protein [Desulfobacterales bacterium]|uniref:Acyl-CoA dehydrogenase family protein n=1 Tax=Candidatus Desulfatibia vada TaxID=2841696 RepID=A0A8J6TSS9_9BACT|nr:acyl-CoA dehydrogenase family protein [Candidatus Desulfatibia vada]MBL6972643.1 acyl-CoA dehydrogenase family protein [Desulfobacterales bacterium]
MIDFTFTEEQEMFRKAAREFAETRVAPKVPEMEETGKASEEVVKAMVEAEMTALTIPEEYGGLGLGYTARLIAVEEVSKVSVATGMMLQVFALGIEPILQFGSEEQKKRFLPALAKGERLAGTAVTEATGGSDPTGIRSTYKKDGDDYILNGRKCFITNSHIGDTMTILARDEEDPKAFSTFIMEKGMEGFKATHEENKVGMRGCNTGELAYENCRVPKENLLGAEGKGIRVALGAIGEVGRGGMVGCALGLQAACLEASIKFANERILYGKPISRLQTIQNKLADMKIDLEAGFLLGYRAAAMQDKGERCSNEFAAAKYFTTEAAQRAAKMAVDIHGGYGCMEEYAVSRYLRDSFVLGPSAGTSDIMKVIVARWALS